MKPPWLVLRYDDNGNEVVMAELATEAEARALAAEFEARGHKQMYVPIERAAYERARAQRGERSTSRS